MLSVISVVNLLSREFYARPTLTVARELLGARLPAGILSSLAAVPAAGFGVSLLVRWVWGKLTKPRRSKATESAP